MVCRRASNGSKIPNTSSVNICRKKVLLGISTSLIATPLQKCDATVNVEQQRYEKNTLQIKEDYDKYAPSYDNLDGGSMAEALGFPDQRKALVQQAQGDVLECAVGTGLNLPFYRTENINSFTAIDISSGMLAISRSKSLPLLPPSKSSFIQSDISRLPFRDESFDSVLDTFSLCVFPDPRAALKSMARVVRKSGKVLLLEHNRSRLLGWYQDLTAVPVAAMGKGCVWNQDVVQLIEDTGMLEIERVEPFLGDLVLSITATRRK